MWLPIGSLTATCLPVLHTQYYSTTTGQPEHYLNKTGCRDHVNKFLQYYCNYNHACKASCTAVRPRSAAVDLQEQSYTQYGALQL